MAKIDSTVEEYQALVNGGSAIVPVYGTKDTVTITHLERDGNVVKVWTDGNIEVSPDYVIVNPPTEIITGPETTIEDPLGAIVQAIHGANR